VILDVGGSNPLIRPKSQYVTLKTVTGKGYAFNLFSALGVSMSLGKLEYFNKFKSASKGDLVNICEDDDATLPKSYRVKIVEVDDRLLIGEIQHVFDKASGGEIYEGSEIKPGTKIRFDVGNIREKKAA
jgi:hypothetical protein